MSLFTDNFVRADGTPGNGWTDQIGGLWSISTNRLKCTPTDQGAGNPVTFDALTQPTNAIGRDIQLVYTIPSNSFDTLAQSLDGIFRYNAGDQYTVDLEYNFAGNLSLAIEKVASTVSTSIVSGTAAIDLTHSYRVTAVAFGVSPTFLCAKVEDLTASTTPITLSVVVDSQADLQQNGPFGLGASRTSGGPGHSLYITSFQVDALQLSASNNTLSWPAVLGATTYKLYRSTTSGSGYALVYTGSSTSVHDDPPAGGAYYYVLTVSDGTNTSGYSNEVSVTMAALAKSITCQAKNTLSWPTYDGATAYVLYRSTTSGSGYSAIYTGASTSYEDDLTVAGTYYYVVTVTTPNGTSGYSNEVHVDAQISTPNVLTGATLSFYPGSNLSAGRYRVSYLVGAYKLNPNRPWGVGFNDNDVQIDGAHGYYVTDGAGNVAHGPGNTLGYTSQSAAEAGNAGQYVYYDHVGGLPIGMYLYDGKYDDNVSGSPSPTFALCGPLVATLTASVLSIDVGDSTTLTWASTNADSATDPVGGTTTSGSQTVSPTVTTTYTFDATGFSGNIEKAVSVTITVNQPTAPTGGTIVGSCGGTIALTWTGATHTASYILERSADGSTGWSQIYTGSTASYTDTPPSPGVVYYYRVKSVKGSATSAPSAVGSANSILAAPTPTFTLTAKGTRVIVAWTDPGAGYAVLTVNIYRSTASGAETLLTSGLAVTALSYTDHGLMSGSTYYYRVSFTNSCGEGTLASEQTATATCCDNVWTPSTAPTSSYSASGAPASTFTASTAPTPAFTASAAPTTTWTASTPPTGTYTPEDCPG